MARFAAGLRMAFDLRFLAGPFLAWTFSVAVYCNDFLTLDLALALARLAFVRAAFFAAFEFTVFLAKTFLSPFFLLSAVFALALAPPSIFLFAVAFALILALVP